jgi:hypothetical protein
MGIVRRRSMTDIVDRLQDATDRDRIDDAISEITAIRADNKRLRAALRNVRNKRREMDMGDLSADEAVWEADDLARAALDGQPAPGKEGA